jgi:adenylate cyclase
VRVPLLSLAGALEDNDSTVRAWAAQGIGWNGPGAAEAVPALVALLSKEDEASRNSACIALRGIGPAAKGALPALRQAALSDPSANVRGFAKRAIEAIEAQPPPKP